MKKTIIDLRTDWTSGKWIPNKEEEYWGGADLIVTDKPLEDRAVVVVTKHAGELSSLITELTERLRFHLDHVNKYEFYPRLGHAANRSIKENGDSLPGIINDVLGEAGDITDEWE